MGWFKSNKSDAPERSPGAKLSLPEIKASDIYGITTLDAAHFVFVLTFNTGEQIVLKAESEMHNSQSGHNYNIGVRIMGMVSAVRSETLTPREVLEVGRFDSGITTEFFRAERAVQGGKYQWIKAAYQQNLVSMKDSYDLRVASEKEKGEARAYIAKLSKMLSKNTKTWKSLGEVLAVDALLGNIDRVNFEMGYISNFGNMMFREKNGKVVEAVGLDTFDSTGQQTGVANMFEKKLDTWQMMAGFVLKDPGKMKNLSLQLIDSGKQEVVNIGAACT
jgi:hypothetical protein